jgi:hypothetical protein
LPVRPKDDGEEVLDLGFLDHSVDSADRAANLSSDSRDGEAGCSESGDPGMPLSLGANDCSGPRSRATRFAGNLLAKPKAPGANGAFVILDLILVGVVKGALEIEGDGDVTDNDREREPSAEIQER